MLALRIALRYLLSKKSHAAVNVISAISVAGVAVATAAIVVVLSVFNGFSDLAASHFSKIDPQLKATPVEGKAFVQADSLAASLAALPQIQSAMPSLTERGLLVAGDAQLGVVFVGVGEQYQSVVDVDSVIVDGAFVAALPDRPAPTLAAVGVAARMGLYPGSCAAELYVPRRVGRINPANPVGAFLSLPLTVTGILQIDQMEFDADHIVVPLDSARRILMYENGEASAIEMRVAPGVSVSSATSAVESALGNGFIVQDRARQQAESFRMIAIEKWVTFTMLIFILLIAAFNIISTLSLMVIEKRDNMATIRSLGGSRSLVRRIFMIQGAAITAAGGLAGCILGVALSLAQQYGGFVRLAGDPAKMTISVYPVRVDLLDILAVAAAIALVALVTSQITRIFTRKIA